MNRIQTFTGAVVLLMSAPAFGEANEAKPIEVEFADAVAFFKAGDKNRDGFIDNEEFMGHAAFTGETVATKVFVRWMADHNTDTKISLQEWVGMELGQFALGDADRDLVLTPAEQANLHEIEEKLFADLGLAG